MTDPLSGPCPVCLRYFRRSQMIETPDGWTHEGCWGRNRG